MRKKLIFCFDIDNTICKTKKGNYSKSSVIKKNIQTINKLYDDGHIIKIFTSRYMGRANSDIKKTYRIGYKKTFNQLVKWNLKFHHLLMGKPRYDVIIDDKSIHYKRNWSKTLIDRYLKK